MKKIFFSIVSLLIFLQAETQAGLLYLFSEIQGERDIEYNTVIELDSILSDFEKNGIIEIQIDADSNISVLPEEIYKFIDLVKLKLVVPLLDSIPSKIKNLQNLEEFLCYSELTYLTEDIKYLINLKKLPLAGCRDFDIAEKISHIPNLTDFYFENKITEVDFTTKKFSSVSITNLTLQVSEQSKISLSEKKFPNLRSLVIYTQNCKNIKLYFEQIDFLSIRIENLSTKLVRRLCKTDTLNTLILNSRFIQISEKLKCLDKAKSLTIFISDPIGEPDRNKLKLYLPYAYILIEHKQL